MASAIEARTFNGMLKHDFVFKSTLDKTNISTQLESIKDRATLLALTIFDLGKKDIHIAPGKTFSFYFGKGSYGVGFVKELSTIFAYLICLNESSDDPKVKKFAEKVTRVANKLLRIKNIDAINKLIWIRQEFRPINNFFAKYSLTKLNGDLISKILHDNTLKCDVRIHKGSGHLIAVIKNDFLEKFLEVYRPEISQYLSDEGANCLQIPDEEYLVIIARKNELINSSSSEVFMHEEVELLFKEPFFSPSRTDNRYAAMASIFIESQDINSIRKNIGLKPLSDNAYRFIFGVVRNRHLPDGDNFLLSEFEKCPKIQSLLQL